MRPLLHGYKFNARLALGQVLTQQLLQAWPWPKPEAVIPVPLHQDRLRERGFDQALEIARGMARHWQVPLWADVLQRTRATSEQSGLKRAERRRNVRQAFTVRGNLTAPGPLLLVDDVMTTGATLDACAYALHKAGAECVWVTALARAGRAR